MDICIIILSGVNASRFDRQHNLAHPGAAGGLESSQVCGRAIAPRQGVGEPEVSNMVNSGSGLWLS